MKAEGETPTARAVVDKDTLAKWLASCVKLLEDISEHSPSEGSKAKLTEWLRRFGYNVVYSNIMVAFERYYTPGDIDTWGYAFSKIGGCCYNTKFNKRPWKGEY